MRPHPPQGPPPPPPPPPPKREALSDLSERDPCDGCDGTCGDVCPVLEAKRLNTERTYTMDEWAAGWRRQYEEACTYVNERDRTIAGLRAENERLRERIIEAHAEWQKDGYTSKLQALVRDCVALDETEDKPC